MRWPPDGYRADVALAVAEYLASDGRLSLPSGDGPVRALEDAYSTLTAVPHVLAVNSGTSALHAAFVALGVGAGDEVVASTYSFHATVTPLLNLGAVPVLADVDPVSGNVDPDSVAALVTDRTKAIVVTHVYGIPADLRRLRRLADERSLPLIEDCSHAHGARVEGVSVGGVGDIGVFSLQESKLAPAGEGGILVTSSERLYERAVFASTFGLQLRSLRDPELAALADSGMGTKHRMHPLAAVCGLVGLRWAERCRSPRDAHARVMADTVDQMPGLRFHTAENSAHYLFRVRCATFERARTLCALASAEGLPIRPASLRPLHELPIFRGHRAAPLGSRADRWPCYRPDDLPRARQFADTLLSVPTYWSPDQADERDEFLSNFTRAIERSAL